MPGWVEPCESGPSDPARHLTSQRSPIAPSSRSCFALRTAELQVLGQLTKSSTPCASLHPKRLGQARAHRLFGEHVRAMRRDRFGHFSVAGIFRTEDDQVEL